MRSSTQLQAGLSATSGQVVAKRRFGKTDVRYWPEVIFKPTYTRDGTTMCVENWAARVQWRGRRELFNLQTANKAAAAAKARDIYVMLAGAGWDVALAKFKPEMLRRNVSTVGDLLAELRAHWPGKEKTFEDYCRAFRTILSQMFGIEGEREKFDYVNGGRDAWRARIERIKLAKITPAKMNQWRIAFVKRAGDNPLAQRRARISCNSLMRQAKSLFASELLVHVTLHKPDILPFRDVAFYPRESMRYRSTIDVEALVQDATKEMPTEPLKCFLLAVMAGQRRNEIDKLLWSAFRWDESLIRMETTAYMTPKTAHSSADVPIDPELLALFRGWHAKASSEFVIESDLDPVVGAKYTHYRAQKHFDTLTVWLRSKGVSALKPLHELRKEFGSQLCAKHGIYAASRMLRHGDIVIPAQHYLDQKERVTVGLGKLLTRPANVTPMKRKRNKTTRTVTASAA